MTHQPNLDRRQWLTIAGTAAAGLVSRRLSAALDTGTLETFYPTRQLTHGPSHHWFGYYDKFQFSPDDRTVLSNRVAFEGRSPRPADSIDVGYVNLDRDTGDEGFVPIGSSTAWGWQQGCMLQFVGNQGRRVLHNDQEGDRLVCRLRDLDQGGREIQTFGDPIYTLSPDGRYGLAPDFRRINNLRPGYGYSGLPDPHNEDPAPADGGVRRVDLATGQSQLILSLADAAAIDWPGQSFGDDAWHYFNHLLVNPSSDRWIVLHRVREGYDPATQNYSGRFITRMLTAAMDGSDVRVVDPSGHTSHFIWRSDDVITAWTRPPGQPWGFYDLYDRPGGMTKHPATLIDSDAMPTNGHNTYLPAPYEDWILNDTYPINGRRQTVYLYHRPSGRRVDLGHFPSPPKYTGEWRCDTHPRCSRDGRQVCIDSPHEGGRQLHLIDIGEALDRYS